MAKLSKSKFMFREISKFIFFNIARFKIVGDFPDKINKYLVIAAPHTSWWDFPMGLVLRSILQKDIRFIGKESLFKGPFGFVFYALGGYPVNRSEKTNMVESMINIFNIHDKFAVAMSPEGTRKRVEKFRTGFYYIAKGANVPIVMVQFNFAEKKVVIREPFHPTDDMEKDMQFIWNYFKGIKGMVPENSVL
jgi:1-acyl-sn-glycerol-3-phosphate acyltransferase